MGRLTCCMFLLLGLLIEGGSASYQVLDEFYLLDLEEENDGIEVNLLLNSFSEELFSYSFDVSF